MDQSLLTSLIGPAGAAAVPWALAASGAVIAVATVVGLGRQRTALERLDERLDRLTAALSLLTNTTEEGLRGVAAEMGRHAAAAPAPEPAPAATLRRRVAAAAGHGRTVQDIASAEQVSEGEVLLHLLLDKLEGARAETC